MYQVVSLTKLTADSAQSALDMGGQMLTSPSAQRCPLRSDAHNSYSVLPSAQCSTCCLGAELRYAEERKHGHIASLEPNDVAAATDMRQNPGRPSAKP